MTLTIDEMATFCKKKGFVYPSSELYGGIAGFFDYGPLGADLKENLKRSWWQFHVHEREDIVGIDGSIIAHPKIWQASGHAECFGDVMVECKKCHERLRADVLIEDTLKIQADGLSAEDLQKLIIENKVGCPKCKANDFTDAKAFNLMFTTNVGPIENEESKAYLRAETAQIIFSAFKNVFETSRMKLPFGIAQMGKAFRNEIAPRNFLFRCREFEQMEIEYFIHPDDTNNCPFIEEVMDYSMLVYSSDMQLNKKEPKEMKIKELLENGVIKTQWHGYWLAKEHQWFVSLGANGSKFRIRQHLPDEKSHYALDTWDLEYEFPFGWKELQGMANRTDFDLQQHMKHSKKDLSIFDEGTQKKIVPHVVAEPSQGVDRAFLVFMYDAYEEDKERGNIVLKLSNKLAPIKAIVCPLIKKDLSELSREVYDVLKTEMHVQYDQAGSIGKRYARADEIGIPYGITIDHDSLEKKDVTIRDRDSTEQKRVKISELKDVMKKLISYEIKFEDL